MATFPFRVLQASWGIAVDVDARVSFLDRAPTTAEEIDSRVFLSIAQSLVLPAVDLDFVRSGLRRLAEDLRNAAEESIALIELDDVDYSPADYQPEGVEAAVIGCVCEILGCEPPTLDIAFDRDENRYVFAYR
jgi:hypothetical protein